MAHSQIVTCIDELEQHARTHLPKNAFDYYSSGANDQRTLAENRAAFYRLRFLPRILRDVSQVDLGVSLLNGTQTLASPICIAPTAMQRMAHPDGEIATARAAAASESLMILSSWSTTSIEDVAAANGNAGARWFQLYVYRDRAVTAQLVKRAEQSGYTALVLTVDTPILGRREADIRNGFRLPPHLRLANFSETDSKATGVSITDKKDSGLAAYVAAQIDQTLTWKDVKWLQSITKLPIILKGVLSPEDATLAVDHGVQGILVSNHGARQLDGVPATIEALPGIVAAVGSRCDVYLDGGVRRGTDVLMALALGAKAVFVGRPVLWGLAYKGEEGVQIALTLLQQELKLAMQLAGCSKLADLTPSLVVSASTYTHAKL
ncbi:peroxisomal glycolate oxidase [Capsaspora owczarzaki ATCC 30864]|uniref:Peroxisomal glycolate oxidase n=1 Tax=Capsaspora owczarzaki (strain ATCC 30864) TaxID=595528 RepID=A0A0D2X266_CAPO3|nr:peroxisomal glycolate oxidase [Capsaspora owczarzaki ATCC 30864]KJE92024.1 peroxisomal glycolate oxidase [Capsaspora owczarzaki ATCC 30864]|eukprot:XP_004363899.2 peroxisomal glycolate oxidase [Capsaspora owczarzaki ATCC 30864]